MWWLFVIWSCGVLFDYGRSLLFLQTDGEWETLRDELYDDIPETQLMREGTLYLIFQLVLFVLACLWPLWFVQGMWKAVTR